MAGRARTSWPERALEAEIPRWEQVIGDHATAVSEADAARSAATAEFLAGRAVIDRALAAIAAQTAETSALLLTVMEYNQSIARFANAAVAGSAANDDLPAPLMVK